MRIATTAGGFLHKYSAVKHFKYRLFQHLTGSLGKKYARKYKLYNLIRAQKDFFEGIKACAGTTYIDLGANIGEYTEAMSRYGSKVIAFEPDPWAYEQLSKRVGHFENVELVQSAAGDRDATVDFFRHPDFDEDREKNSQASSVLSSMADVSEKAVFAVNQIDFVKFLRELDEDIGVLKIDIEGAEIALLNALLAHPDLLNRISYIFCETHENRMPEISNAVADIRKKPIGSENRKSIWIGIDTHSLPFDLSELTALLQRRCTAKGLFSDMLHGDLERDSGR